MRWRCIWIFHDLERCLLFAHPIPERAGSYSHSSLSMAAGPGYRFNRSFSVEARFVTGQFRSTDGQADALQLMGSMRF